MKYVDHIVDTQLSGMSLGSCVGIQYKGMRCPFQQIPKYKIHGSDTIFTYKIHFEPKALCEELPTANKRLCANFILNN